RGPGEGRDPEHVRGPARRRPRPEAGDRPRPPQAGREHRCGAGRGPRGGVAGLSRGAATLGRWRGRAGSGRRPRGRSVGKVRLMCMLVVARRTHPRYPLIVVANRDEALERPTEPLHKWSSERDGVDGIVAGRDVTAGGTWLSLAAGGRFAAVTNVREPGTEPSPISRGRLPVEALAGPVPATGYVRHIAPGLDQYAGVNLLAGDPDELWWASNRSERDPVALDERVHGLSNAQLDTPWPKVTGAVRDVQQLVDADRISGPDWAGPLLDLLADRRKAPLHRLPRTGVPLRREWQLSSRFVRVGRWYGTRSTTAVRIDEHGTADVVERTWDARARIAGAVTARV